MEEQKSSYDSSRELSREADKILKQNGFDIFGRNRRETNFFQINFDNRMQTGAYSRSSESRRKK